MAGLIRLQLRIGFIGPFLRRFLKCSLPPGSSYFAC